MNFSRTQKSILALLLTLLALVAVSSLSLNLMEYLRIFIIGGTLVVIYATFHNDLADNFRARSFLGLAFTFFIYVADPNTNGLLANASSQPNISVFKIISFIILLAAFMLWLTPLFSRAISFNDWRKKFSRLEIYIFSILILFALTACSVECMFSNSKFVINYVLSAVKVIDCCIVYLLIVHGLTYNYATANKDYQILYIATIIFCTLLGILGGAKASLAYSKVRWDNSIKIHSTLVKDRLLRVFALNDNETKLVYQLGYEAGQSTRKEMANKLNQLEKFPRPAIEEIKIHDALIYSNYFIAINLLEKLPLNYVLSDILVEENRKIKNILKLEPNQTSLWYLAGLIDIHSPEQEQPLDFLREFGKFLPQHPNANYFINKFCQDGNFRKTYQQQIAAPRWLIAPSATKTILNKQDYITIMYNQQVTGALWLNKGNYTFNIFARDEGSAKSDNFNPTCKMRVWIDDVFKDFEVYSENKKFRPYSFAVDINTTPCQIVLEFTNDTFDQDQGWDRNLAISHFEIIKN